MGWRAPGGVSYLHYVTFSIPGKIDKELSITCWKWWCHNKINLKKFWNDGVNIKLFICHWQNQKISNLKCDDVSQWQAVHLIYQDLFYRWDPNLRFLFFILLNIVSIFWNISGYFVQKYWNDFEILLSFFRLFFTKFGTHSEEGLSSFWWSSLSRRLNPSLLTDI